MWFQGEFEESHLHYSIVGLVRESISTSCSEKHQVRNFNDMLIILNFI